MKRLLFLLSVLILSLGSYGKKVPDWVKNPKARPVGSYVGKSYPTKECPVERHIMALYFAMDSYMQQLQEDMPNHLEALDNSKFIDWELIDNYVDENGVEYVLLKITPGVHLFMMSTTVFVEESNNKSSSKIEKKYISDVFEYQLLIEIESETDNNKSISSCEIMVTIGSWKETFGENYTK